jgi:adenylate kinase family enzyme
MENLEKLQAAVKGKKMLLLGPTGSGKGNRSKDLKALGLIHIGLGAILREQVRRDPESELSLKVIETTQKGTLLPDDIVVPIILDYLNQKKNVYRTVLYWKDFRGQNPRPICCYQK